jgi:hypothetical protein
MENQIKISVLALSKNLFKQMGVEYWAAMVKYNGATGKWDAQRPVEKSVISTL